MENIKKVNKVKDLSKIFLENYLHMKLNEDILKD